MPINKENHDLKNLFAEQRRLRHKEGIPEFGAMWNKAEKMHLTRKLVRRQKAEKSGFVYRAGFAAAACAILVLIASLISPVQDNSWDAQFVRRAETINSWQPPTASLMPGSGYSHSDSDAAVPTHWEMPTDYLLNNNNTWKKIERNRS